MLPRIIVIFALVGLSLANPSPLQLQENRGYKHAHKTLPGEEGLQLIKPAADLPDNVVPEHYTVRLRMILDPEDPSGTQWTAPGHVDIRVKPIQATRQIVLHRHPTLIIAEDTVTVTATGGSAIKVVNQTYSNDNDNFHTIIMESDLAAGQQYTVSMDYVAPISDSTSGLYRADFKDEQGNQYRLATTQFESIGARQAFPSFDEPRWKTPFVMSLGYKNGTYHTLCNTIVSRTEADPEVANYVWDHYTETVSMPTYLIAILVSNFDYHEAPDKAFGDRPVRIYGEPRYIAPGGNKDVGGGKFAANASDYILAFLESKYVHKYEMPKMDSVAIPNPFFGAGAMENWGLNIYRENLLLFFDGEQTQANKQSIISVLSHELAHQWFGNLVTCKTWENLWLNEGFATYVADQGVYATHPEFDELRERLYSNVQNALNNDVTSTYPIYGLGAPSVMYYDKGGSVIRMMEGFLGEDTLIKGVVNYLNAMEYQAAIQDQLFEHLTAQALADKKIPEGKTMKEIMDTWFNQPGFPLIRVGKVSPTRVYISQERFQPVDNPQYGAMYEIPIALSTEVDPTFSNHTPKLWLSKSQIMTSYTHDTSKWIVLNPDAMGYYRVLYDDDLTKLIMDQLKVKREAISGLSRSQLVDDYFAFANHGHISVTKALDITKLLHNDEGIETDFVVWYTVFNQLTKTLAMFQAHNDGSTHSLNKYLLPKLEAALDIAKWIQPDDEQGSNVIYRTKLLDWACALDSETCLVDAKSYMDAWMAAPDDANKIPTDVQPMMYCAGVAQGNDLELEFMLKKFSEAPVGTFLTQRSKLFNSLSCAKDPISVQKLLNLAINNTSVIGKNPNDARAMIQRLTGNPIGRRIILTFLNKHFEEIVANLSGISSVTSILQSLGGYLTTEAQLAELQSFVAGKAEELKPVENAIAAVIRTVESNIQWIEKNYETMDTWFNAN